MKYPLLFSLALILCSCDSSSSSSDDMMQPDVMNTQQVDPLLQPHLDLFIKEADERGVQLDQDRLDNLTLMFGDLDTNTLGTAQTSSTAPIVIITINSKLKNDNFKWVALHELGHGILRMEHRDENLSIMNSQNPTRFLEPLNEDLVFDEFFQEQFFEEF